MTQSPKLRMGDGSLYKTMSTEREVPIYAVSESDIDNIGRWSALATWGFSIGSAFLSFAVGIWTNFAFADPNSLTAEAKVASAMVAPAFCLIAFVGIGIGLWSLVSRSRAWAAIKDQSKPR